MASNSSSMVAARFLILSDTHNLDLSTLSPSYPLSAQIPPVDVVLHCGDLTHCGGSPSYRKALRLLSTFPAELKLVIAGNHDLDLDETYWKANLDEGDEVEDHAKAVETLTGKKAKDAGVTYLTEGTKTFTLSNGATFTIYTSPYTPEFCKWAFAYEDEEVKEGRFNTEAQAADGITSMATAPIPNFPEVDIVMTHGPPRGILDYCRGGAVGCPNLFQALRRARPRLHCFGHIHEGHGMQLLGWDSLNSSEGTSNKSIQQQLSAELKNQYPEPNILPPRLVHGKHTVMVNAAIMDAENEPTNAPWVVDLQLPKLARDSRS